MAVDRNGFIEAAPTVKSGSKVGKVIVSLCPFLPSSYIPKTPSEMELTTTDNNTPEDKINTNNNSLNNGVRPKNSNTVCKTNNSNTHTTIKETETTLLKQTRVRETVHVTPVEVELDNRMMQLTVRPEKSPQFYNFTKPIALEPAIIRIPDNLLKRKYQEAMRNLSSYLPGMIRCSESIVPKLYSKRIITKSEKEKLRGHRNFFGTETHNELLIDIIEEKSEDEISTFLEVLDELGENELADLIRNTAEEIEKKIYNAGIYSRRQVLRQIGIQNMPAKKEIESFTKQHTTNTLEMVLSTVPNPVPENNNSMSLVRQSGHLVVAFTAKQGNDAIINQVKHCFFKMKSEFTKTLGTHCQCRTYDHRSPDEKSEACQALVSISFEAGEKEAYNILEEKMLDFESCVFEHKGILLTVEEGCIKLKVHVHDIAHLLSLEDDIRSGRLLANMATWFQKEGYQGSEERPMFMLVVDDDRVQHLKKSIEANKNNTESVLTFPVSYTYCKHQEKWLWSADKTYWFDITETVVEKGIYKGMKPEKADLMTFSHLATNVIKPITMPEACIACGGDCATEELKGKAELKEIAGDDSLKGPESPTDKTTKGEARKTYQSSSNGLSFICNQISATLLDDYSQMELQKLIKSEFERTFKALMEDAKANLVFTGTMFEGACFPFISELNITCFFVGSDNKVGYEEDIEEGIRFCITESDDVPLGYLKLKNIGDSSETNFLNSKNTMIQLIDGLNLVVKENSEVIQIEIPIYLQPMADQNKSKETAPSQWVKDKTAKSSLPKLKGCLIKQTKIGGAVTPSLKNLSVRCKHENVPMDCSVNLAYYSVSWPSSAAEWIFRKRESGWPDNKLIDTILTEGCYVIPMVESDQEEYLWKFSFDNVERTLIQSLPKEQNQTLVLLYVLCQKSFVTCGFPSPNQVKNLFLLGSELKQFDNIGSYLLFLLDLMITKIKAKKMPHYFIKDINLLSEGRDDDLQKAASILYQEYENPSQALFAFAKTNGGMPQQKPLEEIFKPVLLGDSLNEKAEVECLKSLIVQLMAEQNLGAALQVFIKLPSVQVIKECFSMMTEDKVKLIGSILPLQEQILSLEYLINTYPNSTSCQSYCAMLATIYHESSIQTVDPTEKLSLVTKADKMFQMALAFPHSHVALKVDYAYFLYNSKSYGKAIEAVKQIIKKPLAADMSVLLPRQNFLYDGMEEKAKIPLLMWPLAFALYITIKSYQAQEKISEAKKYLKQLKDACNRVPEFEGSSTAVSMSSLELLGAAAKDLKEYEISTGAYQKLSNVQAVQNIVLAQNQSAWKLVPPSPSVNSNKFSFQRHGTEKDYEFQI